MTNEAEYDNVKSMVENLHMGVVKHLEGKPGIFKIDQVEKRPVERPVIIAWEQRNTTLLPEDLKSFFMTTDGFHLTWSVKMENGPLPVGRLHINGIGHFVRLNPPTDTVPSVAPSLCDLDFDSDDESDEPSKPKFSGGFRLFELDNCDNYGRVCVVYREPKQSCGESDSESDSVDTDFTCSGELTSEIWFLDRGMNWHYLASSFTDYFRLMIMHLGLPHWQYAFTDMGVPPQAKQWFHMYAPTRLEIDINTPRNMQGISSAGVGSKQVFDPTKVFKSKSEKKKVTGVGATNPSPSSQNSNQNRSTKKAPVSSARSVGSSGSKPLSQSSSSNSLVKSSR
ncbi:tubulin polyglutamylase complex subunit 2-like isoform X2 [Littorina saxatilis]|uniref:tubulin polyglutamylase complex subunit 2-like isoform X2 n=1 Tax=Littorina saxatilis TaxID=31220 RepID=UPI0038B5676E